MQLYCGICGVEVGENDMGTCYPTVDKPENPIGHENWPHKSENQDNELEEL